MSIEWFEDKFEGHYSLTPFWGIKEQRLFTGLDFKPYLIVMIALNQSTDDINVDLSSR